VISKNQPRGQTSKRDESEVCFHILARRELDCIFYDSLNLTTKKLKMRQAPIPIIDLFAGPGGLGEGFSSVLDKDGNPVFKLKVSIEKDPTAHETLSLRAMFRSFPKHDVPDAYYKYIRGEISKQELMQDKRVIPNVKKALEEAKNAELGKTSTQSIDTWISTALKGAKDWVLIGGPPCQAYSVVGRSRRTNESVEKFESDEKHTLYKEYLRIIQRFKPSVFVMENVKGILSSTLQGTKIFQKILSDLSNPSNGLSYEIRSFVVPKNPDDLRPSDYVIKAEEFGIPQARHRVILFGILKAHAASVSANPAAFILQKHASTVSTYTTLVDLPEIRSRISKGKDSYDMWQSALAETLDILPKSYCKAHPDVHDALSTAVAISTIHSSSGGKYIPSSSKSTLPKELRNWLIDNRIKGVVQHESRSHMRSDLHRYIFASAFAKAKGRSPKIEDFPKPLLPEHRNVNSEKVPFSDRFKVQISENPSTTVVAHIAKDGHYYIHPDPSQARSLTLREAARLQTFPDNYFFEGNRTEQYTQVGNAVPPLLAYKIAIIVAKVLNRH
jgi:DNA (cytosine-5)-methyltransferase 1